jgi:hypothetical protein
LRRSLYQAASGFPGWTSRGHLCAGGFSSQTRRLEPLVRATIWEYLLFPTVDKTILQLISQEVAYSAGFTLLCHVSAAWFSFLLIGFQAAGFPLDLALRPWVVFLRFLFQTNSVITRSYTSCHGSNFLSNNNNTKPTYRICSFAWFYHGTGPSSPWPWPICPGAGCSITSYYDKYQVQWPFGAASPRLLEISVLFFRWLTHP